MPKIMCQFAFIHGTTLVELTALPVKEITLLHQNQWVCFTVSGSSSTGMGGCKPHGPLYFLGFHHMEG